MKNSQYEIYWLRLKRYFRNLDRIGKMWYFLLGFSMILVFALFSFTILNNDFYSKMAEAQQKTIIKNPISRGSILSSSESLGGVLAVSTNLGTLAIDPSQTGSQIALLELLSDAVYTEFCAHQTQEICVKNISAYVRNDTLNASGAINEASLKKSVSEYLETRINSPIESVALALNLDDDAVQKINNLNSEALFFASNNLYVNPTRVKDGGTLAAALSPIIGKTVEEITPKFEIKPKKYLEIIRKMSVTTRDLITTTYNKNREEVSKMVREARAKYELATQKDLATEEILLEHAIYPYIVIEDNLVRYYPEGNSLGQITGFVDNE